MKQTKSRFKKWKTHKYKYSELYRKLSESIEEDRKFNKLENSNKIVWICNNKHTFPPFDKVLVAYHKGDKYFKRPLMYRLV